MDKKESLAQNIASSGGIVPLSLIIALIVTGQSDIWTTLRTASNTLAGIVSLLICYVTASLVLDEHAGHRWLNSLALMYFGARSLAHIWNIWDWWYQIDHLPYWMSSVMNGTEIIFGMYYYVTRRDLCFTYKRSEQARQENIRRLDNINQAALNLEHLALMQSHESLRLTEYIANVGRDLY